MIEFPFVTNQLFSKHYLLLIFQRLGFPRKTNLKADHQPNWTTVMAHYFLSGPNTDFPNAITSIRAIDATGLGITSPVVPGVNLAKVQSDNGISWIACVTRVNDCAISISVSTLRH
jgi:hypothetical protein